MDDKLKKLANKQSIDISESFERKFEESLNNLPDKNDEILSSITYKPFKLLKGISFDYKKNKYTMVASLALVIIVSSGVVMAISDKNYKYVPSSGIVFDSENSVYGLEEPIVGVDSNGEELELQMFISEEMDRAVVNIGGEFNIPKSTKAELKIGNKIYENEREDVSELEYTWGLVDVFSKIGDYNENDKITYT
ncbi:MAG: hypothetical protein ACRC3Y_11905, partial [Romboutsia sp.]|uniref:hypothetical protein n=1 Tax=Romboutsia sp. TaxID=1965302 RepID=UPI003F2B5DEF